MAQILLRRSRGEFEPYSPLTSQGKVVVQVVFGPTNLQVVFGEIVVVFGELEGVFGNRCKFLTIWILNLKIICEDLKLGGVYRC